MRRHRYLGAQIVARGRSRGGEAGVYPSATAASRSRAARRGPTRKQPAASSNPPRLTRAPVTSDAGGYPWSGVLLGLGLVLSPAYWLGNQAIVQRALGARDTWSARASMIFGALLKTAVPAAFVLPGLLGIVLLQGEGIDPNEVYPTLIQQLLPVDAAGRRAAFKAERLPGPAQLIRAPDVLVPPAPGRRRGSESVEVASSGVILLTSRSAGNSIRQKTRDVSRPSRDLKRRNWEIAAQMERADLDGTDLGAFLDAMLR